MMDIFGHWICYCIGVFLIFIMDILLLFKGIGAIAENNKAIVISKLIQVFISYILLKMGRRPFRNII